jgi:hypothetical protein
MLLIGLKVKELREITMRGQAGTAGDSRKKVYKNEFLCLSMLPRLD